MSSFKLSPQSQPIKTPRGDLAYILGPKLTNWIPDVIAVVDYNRGYDRYAHPRAIAALALIDDALDRLSSKTCDRSKEARGALRAQREPIAAAVAHVDSLRADFTGPLAQSFISRMVVAGDVQLLESELVSALTKLEIPPMPDASDFAKAKQETEALERQPAKNVRASDVRTAIEQGMSAPTRSALWIAYETKADHPLIQWRAQALAERGA